jgi:hypothetical protein
LSNHARRRPHTLFTWEVELARPPPGRDLSQLALSGGVAALPGPAAVVGGGSCGLLAGVVCSAIGRPRHAVAAGYPAGAEEEQQAPGCPSRKQQADAGRGVGAAAGGAMVGRILRSRPARQPGEAGAGAALAGGHRGVLALELCYAPLVQHLQRSDAQRAATYASGAAEVPPGACHASPGILTVTLLTCAHLVGARGAPDPYVELVLEDPGEGPAAAAAGRGLPGAGPGPGATREPRRLVQRSSVVFNDSSPRWREKFDFVGVSAASLLKVGRAAGCLAWGRAARLAGQPGQWWACLTTAAASRRARDG